MKTNLPEEVKTYTRVEPDVEHALTSSCLSRIFMLIIDGMNSGNDGERYNYTKGLAKRYGTRPEIMAQHLGILRNANLIMRDPQKKDRIQYYLPNWEGLLDVIKFRGLSKRNPYFKLSTLFYKVESEPDIVESAWNNPDVRTRITKEISDTFLSKYMLARLGRLLMPLVKRVWTEKTGKGNECEIKAEYVDPPRDFSHMKVTLLDILRVFDSVMSEVIPRLYQGEFEKISNPVHPLINHYCYINRIDRACLDQAPEGVMLKEFEQLLGVEKDDKAKNARRRK